MHNITNALLSAIAAIRNAGAQFHQYLIDKHIDALDKLLERADDFEEKATAQYQAARDQLHADYVAAIAKAAAMRTQADNLAEKHGVAL